VRAGRGEDASNALEPASQRQTHGRGPPRRLVASPPPPADKPTPPRRATILGAPNRASRTSCAYPKNSLRAGQSQCSAA
jgi:hypothetical protein